MTNAKDPRAEPCRDDHAGPDRRRFRLWFSRVGRGVPAVLFAVTTPIGGCYLSHALPPLMDAGAPIDAPIRPPDTGRLDVGPPPVCSGWGWEETLVVELPPPGVPADPALLCAAPGLALESGAAARVELEVEPADPSVARGTIRIDPSLAPVASSEPSVRMIEGATYFGEPTISPVSREGDVFRFDMRFASPLRGTAESYWRMVLETRLDIACADGSARTVIAQTIVHLCHDDAGGPTLVSSGEECRTCAIIAEMAPTPIVPMERPDGIPLQRGIHLKVRPIARFDNAVVLLAEHDQSDRDVTYAWSSSAGKLHEVACDVVVWAFDPSTELVQMVQVALETDGAAAVASHRRGAGL